jgi:Zn-dependent peptidase ImmA (M78 family)
MSVLKQYKFYSKQEIEACTNDLLRDMSSKNFPPKWPFDASRMADFLDLKIVWSTIPSDNEGTIAAKIEPTKRLITLNENLLVLKQKVGFEQSTIAHEIGHWMLHINQDEADGLVKQLEFSFDCLASEELFLCRNVTDKIEKISRKTQNDWREWQAQYFASCLLMPRHILEQTRKGRNLQKWNHLYPIADELGVTISNLVNRLKDLGWINIPNGSQQIYLGNGEPNGQTSLFP